MAVIRQQTQVFNKPIGVVRAEAGGQELANSISRAAETYSARMYKRASEEANKAGQEKALATATSDIAALDPNTNKPVVYNPPAQFGTIASAAYQDIIDRRFEDSITLELQSRGSEFAKTSGSASQYKDRMAQYVEQMYNAEGEDTFYKRYVQEAGAAYVQKTFSALRKKEINAVRARTKKESKLAFALEVIDIKNAIQAGQLSPELQQKIENLNANALTGYLAGANTISDVTQANDFAMGFDALSANSKLANIYMNSDNVTQAQIKQALLDPVNSSQYIPDPQLRGTIHSSLRGKATSTQIISALEANEEELNNIADARNLEFVEDFPVTEDMSFAQVKALYAEQSQESQSQAYEDLFVLKLDEFLDFDNMDVFVNELQKPKGLIDESVFPESVRGIVGSMSEADIADLASNLKARQSALNGIKQQELNTSLEQVALNLEGIASAGDIFTAIEEYEFTRKSIDNIPDPTKRRDKRGAAEAELSLKISQFVDPREISLDRLKEINSAIKQNVPSIEGTKEELSYFKSVSQAYKISRATIEARMGTFEEERAKEVKAQIDRTELESAIEAASNGEPLNKAQRAAMQAHIYGEDIPTPQFLMTSNSFRSRAMQNSILDVEFESIESGLQSTDQETQIAAFELFRQLQNIQQDTGLEIVKRNLIVGRVNDDTYNAANAAVVVSSLSGDAPNVVMANIMAYSGNMDAVIREGLGIQSINDLFSNADLGLNDFSSSAQEEFKAILRYAVASDRPINSETLKSIKNSYTSLMVEDDRVLGTRVGDLSRFGLNLAFDDSEVEQVYGYVLGKMSEDPQFAEYLETRGLGPRIAEGMTIGSKRAKQAVKAVMANEVIKFEPIKETWIGDGDKSYIVKILSSSGGYITMIPDGFPVIVSKSQFEESETDERSLFSYKNALTAAANSGNKRGTALAGLEYLLKLDPEKYPDLDSVKAIPRDDYFINEQLTDEEIQEIIEGMQRGE